MHHIILLWHSSIAAAASASCLRLGQPRSSRQVRTFGMYWHHQPAQPHVVMISCNALFPASCVLLFRPGVAAEDPSAVGAVEHLPRALFLTCTLLLLSQVLSHGP